MLRRGRPVSSLIAATVTLAVVSSFVLVASTQAAGADPLPPNTCSTESGFTINFLNGVSNTYAQAFKSRQTLKNRYGTTHDSEPITYNSLYNDTHGLALDLEEVFDQKVREAVQSGLLTVEDINKIGSSILGTTIKVVSAPSRWFAGLLSHVPIGIVQDAAKDYANFLGELPGWYEAASNSVTHWMTDQVGKFADVTLLDPETRHIIDNHATTIRSQIASGQKSLIVAHSQGNLFANPIYDEVKDAVPSDSLRVVHVATPTVLTSGPYVTSDTDLVIGPMIALGIAKPANVHLEPFIGNNTNHDFTAAYMLKGHEPHDAIIADMDEQLDALVPSTSSGSDGLFTVTLTWAGSGDVDLHVIEPNGNHVFYANKAGTSGYLDVDNTFADGPEHYFAACDSSGLVGDFTVSVQNYAAPTNVPVQVQLSSADRVYEPVPLNIGAQTFSSSPGTIAFHVEARLGPNGKVIVSELP